MTNQTADRIRAKIEQAKQDLLDTLAVDLANDIHSSAPDAVTDLNVAAFIVTVTPNGSTIMRGLLLTDGTTVSVEDAAWPTDLAGVDALDRSIRQAATFSDFAAAARDLHGNRLPDRFTLPLGPDMPGAPDVFLGCSGTLPVNRDTADLFHALASAAGIRPADIGWINWTQGKATDAVYAVDLLTVDGRDVRLDDVDTVEGDYPDLRHTLDRYVTGVSEDDPHDDLLANYSLAVDHSPPIDVTDGSCQRCGTDVPAHTLMCSGCFAEVGDPFDALRAIESGLRTQPVRAAVEAATGHTVEPVTDPWCVTCELVRENAVVEIGGNGYCAAHVRALVGNADDVTGSARRDAIAAMQTMLVNAEDDSPIGSRKASHVVDSGNLDGLVGKSLATHHGGRVWMLAVERALESYRYGAVAHPDGVLVLASALADADGVRLAPDAYDGHTCSALPLGVGEDGYDSFDRILVVDTSDWSTVRVERNTDDGLDVEETIDTGLPADCDNPLRVAKKIVKVWREHRTA